MQNFLKQFDHFSFTVSKEQVESGDIQTTLGFFKETLGKRELKDIQRRASLSFNGYDDVPEELYEITEVVVWVRKFISALPAFFYFFEIKTIYLLALYFFGSKESEGGRQDGLCFY